MRYFNIIDDSIMGVSICARDHGLHMFALFLPGSSLALAPY